ncbi:MAG: LptF/LptG family permease [Hyphomicrobiales bacterium]
MFSVLDRYVLRQVMLPLGVSLLIGLFMMLAERMVRLLETVLGKKDSFGAVFELLAYLVPHYLGMAIPAALFIGLLFGFNKLSKNHEVEGMMAAGMGLHRVARPTISLACLFSVASLGIFGWLQPYTRYAYRTLIFDIRNVDVFYLAQEGVFMQSGSRTFILDELDRGNNVFKRIFIYDDKTPYSAETLTASDGILIPVEGQPRPVLRLNNGHRLFIENLPQANGDPVPPATVAEFNTMDTPLGKVKKDIVRPRGVDERELTLPELFTGAYTPSKDLTANDVLSEVHWRIVNILGMMVLPFLAVPFAVSHGRSPRAYRLALAIGLLVAFHEIIQQGALATRSSGLSPYLTLWLPLGALTAFAGWRFFLGSFRLKTDRSEGVLQAIHETLSRVVSPVTRLFRRRLVR